VRITHHPRHTRQRGQFFWRPLRVAAGHQYAAIRIHPLQPPYRGARVLIRALGHGASVQHDNFGVASRARALQSALQELALQRCPICLRSAAAKIFYVEASHAPILNEWMLRLNRLPKKSVDFCVEGARLQPPTAVDLLVPDQHFTL